MDDDDDPSNGFPAPIAEIGAVHDGSVADGAAVGAGIDENSSPADDFDPSAFLNATAGHVSDGGGEASGDISSLVGGGLLPSLPAHFIHESPAMITNQVEPIVAPDGTKGWVL